MATTISPSYEVANSVLNKCKESGIVQLTFDDYAKDGRIHLTNKKTVVSFSNCSYLGLELDDRLKKGAIEAIHKYGTQVSCSRSFLQIPLYDEAEALLSNIFGSPTLLAPTTTLAHSSLIPIFTNSTDAILIDQQAHNSVQSAVAIAKSKGTYIETIRHNRLDILESRIQKLREKYDKIWYMADGVYSMYGDTLPVSHVHELLNTYDNFYCYIDDAHGMSWEGVNGSGYVLSRMPLHNKMILTTSLAKGFGVVGSAMIFPNEEMKNIARNICPALMFSGPIQPANLGAIIASAKIHLKNEIYEKQEKIKDLIRYFILTCKGLDLPLIGDSRTPIFFVGVGEPEKGFKICKKMLDDGYFLNIAVFPAVPYKNTGLRIALTVNHTYQDINEMLSVLTENLYNAGDNNQLIKKNISKAFSLAY
jgi:7-keto-8-aminopelargonate synthetase-like enzyme